jgi:hypothetical protein
MYFSFLIYKQNSGRTNKKGSNNGTSNKDAPHVQVLLRMSTKMVIKTVMLIMKHPPRRRYWTKTVLPLPMETVLSWESGFPPNSKKKLFRFMVGYSSITFLVNASTTSKPVVSLQASTMQHKV